MTATTGRRLLGVGLVALTVACLGGTLVASFTLIDQDLLILAAVTIVAGGITTTLIAALAFATLSGRNTR